jgi:hypothetical protein
VSTRVASLLPTSSGSWQGELARSGVTASLSPRLRFRVKLPLLARDRHDLLLRKLALSTTWFDPLVTPRGGRSWSLLPWMRMPPREGWQSSEACRAAGPPHRIKSWFQV